MEVYNVGCIVLTLYIVGCIVLTQTSFHKKLQQTYIFFQIMIMTVTVFHTF